MMNDVARLSFRVRFGYLRRAYTLVEILVVLFVLMLLAAIALPTVKDLLSNQKTSRAARNLVAFIDKARSRAIAEQRPFGVLIERGAGNVDALSLSQSIRVRQIAGVPPYSGDASNAYALLSNHPDPTSDIAFADFTVRDNSLLDLSRRFYSGEERLGTLDQVPIRNGDHLELPGGRLVPVTILPDLVGTPQEPLVRLTFSLANLYPEGRRSFPTSPQPKVKYRIHRHPVVSAVTPFSMPRGVVIDLNFSGVGLKQNNFCPIIFSDPDVPPLGGDVEIIFGPDGGIERVTQGPTWTKVGTQFEWQWEASQTPPLGTVFLCVGDADGLWSDTEGLLSRDNKTLSNLLNLESIWVTVNAYTGRATSSPMHPLDVVPNGIAKPSPPAKGSGDYSTLQTALQQSRRFATLTDSVETE